MSRSIAAMSLRCGRKVPVRRNPVQLQPYKASVDTAGDNALMLRFETADATVNATLSIRMMQQLHEQIGQLIETKKITRAWGGHLNAAVSAEAPQGAVVEEDLAPGADTGSR
jgi:hypothetical protein